MKNSDSFSAAMRMAQSETGQQLLKTLQSQNSETLERAMAQAASGNTEQAKQTLSALLQSPQVRQLLEQLGRNGNG